jgi:hypothetical protein
VGSRFEKVQLVVGPATGTRTVTIPSPSGKSAGFVNNLQFSVPRVFLNPETSSEMVDEDWESAGEAVKAIASTTELCRINASK